MTQRGIRRFASAVMTFGVVGFALPPGVDAQGPATIRGVVYSCNTHAAVPNARVVLHGLDDGATIPLTANQNGQFIKVGLTPGRYLISATPPLPPPWDKPWTPHGAWPKGMPYKAFTSSRLARLETDDILDVRIGTRPPSMVIAHLTQQGQGPTTIVSGESSERQPAPACDTALVPMAPTSTSRYIVH